MTTTAPQKTPGVLEEETRTWLAHQGELMRQAPGKFVVIQGGRVFGIFDDSADAYARAYRQFGDVAFLLRPIQWREEVYSLGGSALGDDLTGGQEGTDAASEAHHP